MTLLRAAVAGLLLSACARITPPPDSKPVSTVPNAIATDDPSAQPPARGSGRHMPYAPSPLTDLAKAVTELTITVLSGKPPPAGPIPIERTPADRELVSGKIPRLSDLEFFMFGAELIVVLDDADDGALRVIVMLGKTGIRLVSARTSQGRQAKPLTGWLAGANQLGNDIADAARAGKLASMELRESDRSVFGDDRLFDVAMSERPKAEQLAELETAAKKYPRVRGVIVDELYLLAHGGPGEFWGIQLNVDDDDGQAVLDSAPLLRIESKNMNEREAPEAVAPEPPPPPAPPPPPPPRKAP